MREQHPIDELFRQALQNAEMAPPSGAWTNISAERSWGHQTLSKLRRRWKYGLLLLLLISGAGGMLLNVNPNDGPIHDTSNQVSVYASAHEGNLVAEVQKEVYQYERDVKAIKAETKSEDSVSDMGGTRTTSSALNNDPNATSALEQTSTIAAPTTVTKTAPSTFRRVASNTGNEGVPTDGSNVTSGGNTDNNHTANQTQQLDPSSSINDSNTNGSEGEVLASIGGQLLSTRDALNTGMTKKAEISFRRPANEFDAALMRPRLSDTRNNLPSKRITSRHQPAPKALPPGEWWVGGEVGMYSINGAWTATRAQARRLAESMNQAENWRSSLSVDFIAGRQWGNGVQLSLGIGLENIRSRFEFNETQQVEVMLDSTSILVNQEVVSSSKNVLSVFRIPVEAAWHKQWHRFMAGPRIGLVNEFFMTQDGLTLTTSDADQSATAINSDAGSVSKRYPFRMTGSVGVDVGYMFTESLSLWVTPTYTHDLFRVGGGEMAPDLSRIGARCRLQYLLSRRY